eukprot:SAG31_NODE_686_length_12815_cov_5.367175_8_plen_771_part_00
MQLFEKYGTLIERNTALIEKVSPCRWIHHDILSSTKTYWSEVSGNWPTFTSCLRQVTPCPCAACSTQAMLAEGVNPLYGHDEVLAAAELVAQDKGVDLEDTSSVMTSFQVSLDRVVDEKVAQQMNAAFIFVKPHANTPATVQMVTKLLESKGLVIKSTGTITAEEIDSKKLIDQHYYAIASKATILKPAQLNVPADKFEGQFGIGWQAALDAGKVFNAMDACEKLGLDAEQMDAEWGKCKKAKKLIKFGGGFYCGLIEIEGKEPIYVFNGFFMQMRTEFTKPGLSITYFVVEWSADTLPWADFRGKLLGPTDPAEAPADSARGMILAQWKELGLTEEPNTGLNGVHASASPFEAMAEINNWLQTPISDIAYGQELLNAGLTDALIKEWSIDPQVVQPDTSKGSLFDSVEDLDRADCTAKLRELYLHRIMRKAWSAAEKRAEDNKRVDTLLDDVAKTPATKTPATETPATFNKVGFGATQRPSVVKRAETSGHNITIAHLALLEQATTAAKCLFKQVDTNGDNTISMDEMEARFGSKAKEWMEKFDKNNDSMISQEEMVDVICQQHIEDSKEAEKWMKELTKIPPEDLDTAHVNGIKQELTTLFESIDKDSSGSLSYKELDNALHEVKPNSKSKRYPDGKPTQRAKSFAKTMANWAKLGLIDPNDDLETRFHHIDSDHSGLISLQEFLKFVDAGVSSAQAERRAEERAKALDGKPMKALTFVELRDVRDGEIKRGKVDPEGGDQGHTRHWIGSNTHRESLPSCFSLFFLSI